MDDIFVLWSQEMIGRLSVIRGFHLRFGRIGEEAARFLEVFSDFNIESI